MITLLKDDIDMSESEEMQMFMDRLHEAGVTDSDDPIFHKLFGETFVTPELDKQLISELRQFEASHKNDSTVQQ